VYHLHPWDILLHPRDLELVLLWQRQEAMDGVLQLILVVMAPRSDGLLGGVSHNITDGLKAGPWCLQRTLDPEMISVTALNSTCPGCETPLIRYLGAEVMPKCPSRARSLPVGIRASAPKDSISSASLYTFSPSVSLKGEYSSWSSSLLLTSWSCCYCCSSAGAP
jgi:hypothetical protein